MHARRPSLLALGLLAGCTAQGFSLPPRPESPQEPEIHAVAAPAAAFAGQSVTLSFDQDVAAPALTVSIGGRVATAKTLDARTATVEMPAIEGACRRTLPVEIAVEGEKVTAAPLEYLGAGHPGAPRPSVSRVQPLRFAPDRLVSIKKEWVASAFGTVVAVLDDGFNLLGTHAVPDFPVALNRVLGANAVAWAGRYGAFGVIPIEHSDVAIGCAPGQTCTSEIGPAISGLLPSAVFDSPPALAVTGSAGPDTLDVDGRVLGPADSPASLLLSEEMGALVVVPEQQPVSPKAALVAPADGFRHYAFLSPGAPAGLDVLEDTALTHFDLPTDVNGMTASLVRTAPISTGFAVASVWSSPQGVHKLLFGSVTRGTSPTLQPPVVAEVAIPAPYLDAAVLQTKGAIEVLAVDGDTHLVHHRLSTGLVATLETATLPDAGRAVAARLENDGSISVAVADAAGGLHRFSLPPSGSLVPGLSSRLALGARAIAPDSGDSCSGSEVVVNASALGGSVAAPFRGGTPTAFLGEVTNAFFSSAVGLDTGNPSHAQATFLVSANSDGALVSETVVQARAFSRERAAKLVAATGAASAVLLQSAAERATVLLGGADGLFWSEVTNAALTGADPLVVSTSTDCKGITALIRSGAVAVALSKDGDGTRLCTFDAATGAVKKGPLLPSAWQVSALAAATGALPGGAGGASAHVFLGGRVSGDGDRALLFADVALAEVSTAIPHRFTFGDRLWTLLPTGGVTLTALAASPDARRLFAGFSGSSPGVVAFDPLLMLSADSTDDERAETLTSLSLPASPRGFNVSSDGARVVAVLDNDSLAEIR